MGRQEPSKGLAPAALRKDARAKKAKLTMSKDIPAILHSDARAKVGVESSELISSPILNYDPSMTGSISLRTVDTLQAAHDFHGTTQGKKGKKPRITILNMASPLRPGGGVLTGATSQEESLCLRTTLHPSLREEFYRLPEVGAVYTPDVLVFRTWDEHATDLSKSERFYVDVITAAMLRFPDLEQDEEGIKTYSDDQDRELAERKMRAVMAIARLKGSSHLVLGAWGCGAYGNPVNEIAPLWRKVLLGLEDDSGIATKASESLTGQQKKMEIVFAIRSAATATLFAQHFGSGLVLDQDETRELDVDDCRAEESDIAHRGNTSAETRSKITELEAQIAQTRSPILKERLQVVLMKLRKGDD